MFNSIVALANLFFNSELKAAVDKLTTKLLIEYNMQKKQSKGRRISSGKA